MLEEYIRSFSIKLQKESNNLLSLSQLLEEFLTFTLGKYYDFPINPFQSFCEIAGITYSYVVSGLQQFFNLESLKNSKD